jgi:hypothetical protein
MFVEFQRHSQVSVEEYLTDQAAIWTPRTPKQRRVLLEANVYPHGGPSRQ